MEFFFSSIYIYIYIYIYISDLIDKSVENLSVLWAYKTHINLARHLNIYIYKLNSLN